MKSNQKSMKWGVDLRAQQGRNHRDEWLKKRRSCNTILDEHIKNLTPKKGQLVRPYTNMLFWSQNQVQTKRFPVSVCKKHGILLTSDLFEAKPCEHVAVPWHHPPNPPKLMQNPPPSEGSWGFTVPALAVGHPNLLLKLQSSPVYFLRLNMFKWFPWIWRYKVISVFVTNPYKSLKPVQLHQHVDFNFPPWPVRSHSMYSWELRCWLRPQCEIYTWTNDEGMLSYQTTFKQWLNTENEIHPESIRVQ